MITVLVIALLTTACLHSPRGHLLHISSSYMGENDNLVRHLRINFGFIRLKAGLFILFVLMNWKLKILKKATISGRYAHFWFYSIGSLNQFELIKYLSIQQIWTRINIFLPRQRQDVNWFISTRQFVNLSICKPFLVVWSQFCINESAYASPNKMFKPHICLATFVASFIKFRFDVKEHVYIV